MGRAEKTVHGKATVSRQEGATEEKRQEVCRYIQETAGQSSGREEEVDGLDARDTI